MVVDGAGEHTRVPRPPTARGRRTRESIVDVAATLMQRQGIAATGLGDVLEASATGKSQMYHYFSGKQELVRAVLDRQLERVLAAQPELDGDDVAAWARSVAARHQGPGGPYSCPLGVFSGQVDDDPVLRAHLDTAFGTWRARIARMVVAAQRAGQADPAGDPDRLATGLLAALQGGIMLARLHRDPCLLDDALAPVLDRVTGHG